MIFNNSVPNSQQIDEFHEDFQLRHESQLNTLQNIFFQMIGQSVPQNCSQQPIVMSQNQWEESKNDVDQQQDPLFNEIDFLSEQELKEDHSTFMNLESVEQHEEKREDTNEDKNEDEEEQKQQYLSTRDDLMLSSIIGQSDQSSIHTSQGLFSEPILETEEIAFQSDQQVVVENKNKPCETHQFIQRQSERSKEGNQAKRDIQTKHHQKFSYIN